MLWTLDHLLRYSRAAHEFLSHDGRGTFPGAEKVFPMERQRILNSIRQTRSCRIFFVLFVTACVATAPHILECACWGIKTRCVYLWTLSWIDKRFFACAVPSPLKKDSADAPRMWNMVQCSPCWQLLLIHCCCTFFLPASVVLDSVTKALSDLSTSTLMKVRAVLLLPGQHRAIHLSGEFTDTNFSSGRDASIWHDTQ